MLSLAQLCPSLYYILIILSSRFQFLQPKRSVPTKFWPPNMSIDLFSNFCSNMLRLPVLIMLQSACQPPTSVWVLSVVVNISLVTKVEIHWPEKLSSSQCSRYQILSLLVVGYWGRYLISLAPNWTGKTKGTPTIYCIINTLSSHIFLIDCDKYYSHHIYSHLIKGSRQDYITV